MKKFLLALMFLSVMSACSYSADNAILVKQPAYNSMSFYVYKPANIPNEFYVTYDGYYVYRDNKGVWLYGSGESYGILKTGYVVGSVIPSVVRLKPYDSRIASVAPVLGSNRANVSSSQSDPTSSRVRYMPLNAASSTLSQDVSDWTQNTNFMAVSKWKHSVDRIGVIQRPAIPIAWKGDYPEVIYAWTGTQWRQINAKGKHTAMMSTLRRELYDLTVYTNKINRLNWTNDDSNVLAQLAETWGYEWQGAIIPGRIY